MKWKQQSFLRFSLNPTHWKPHLLGCYRLFSAQLLVAPMLVYCKCACARVISYVTNLMTWHIASLLCPWQRLTARWRSMSARCNPAKMTASVETTLPNTRVSAWLASKAETARSTLMNVPACPVWMRASAWMGSTGEISHPQTYTHTHTYTPKFLKVVRWQQTLK